MLLILEVLGILSNDTPTNYHKQSPAVYTKQNGTKMITSTVPPLSTCSERQKNSLLILAVAM